MTDCLREEEVIIQTVLTFLSQENLCRERVSWKARGCGQVPVGGDSAFSLSGSCGLSFQGHIAGEGSNIHMQVNPMCRWNSEQCWLVTQRCNLYLYQLQVFFTYCIKCNYWICSKFLWRLHPKLYFYFLITPSSQNVHFYCSLQVSSYGHYLHD